MPKFHTVIPIHNVRIGQKVSWKFGAGMELKPVPGWLRGQSMLDNLSSIDRDAVNEANHALVTTYPAEALGSPDPASTVKDPRSIQEAKYEVGVLANLALWLARPSPACFAIVIHAPLFGTSPTVQQTQRCSELLCHPDNVEIRITRRDLPLAAKLHKSLLKVPRDTAIWTAIRAGWAGLQMNIETVRCLLFWVAIEALFGPADGREIKYRLSQRAGLFLGSTPAQARSWFQTAKSGYDFRSKIVHGVWNNEPKATTRMAEAEELFRLAMVRVLERPSLRARFSSGSRESFLDGLVFG
jgi:hypothetical protein